VTLEQEWIIALGLRVGLEIINSSNTRMLNFVHVASRAVLQFSWSFKEHAGWLFLEKKSISGHHVPSTPTGKPL
jgi:hypothetical protein